MPTPSFVAEAFRGKFDFSQYLVSDSASNWVLFCQGCESTLTTLITKWQKGFRNDLFREWFDGFF